MRCQPLFHEKNWKGPLARHEETNVLCIISSLNSLKRLSISAFKLVSRYFDHIVNERKKLIRYIVNRNEHSVVLQVVHLLKMEQCSPALEQKLFRK